LDADATADSARTNASIVASTSRPVTEAIKQTKDASIAPSKSAKASARAGSQMRESSPSLARDIASRRGIPSQSRSSPSAAAQARARQLSPESQRRASPSSLKIPPSVVDSQASIRDARKRKADEDEEGFTKFYNNLTTGTMSKLSSVLAYAGLPLTADDIKPEQMSSKRTVSASHDPDVKKYISKAALEAVEEDHRERGKPGHGFGPAESFYVVQTGGGTYSYADIAKATQSHLSGIDEEDDEAFVDAKELPGPSSPLHSRTAHEKRSIFGKNRTHEELELENSTLKGTLEDLARRLANFEAHAQDASMMALTQSMASLRPADTPAGGSMQERVEQLEKQIEQQTGEQQALKDEAMRKDKILKKYQSRYEQLVNGARERGKAKKEKVEKESDELVAGVPDVS